MNVPLIRVRRYKARRHEEVAFLPARYAALLIAAVAVVLALGLLIQA